MSKDERRLTLIVVPHGDLETRTFELPYWKLRFGLYLGLAIVALLGFVVATWFPVAAQAGRARALEAELRLLEEERAQVAELAETLAEVEAQYERVRQLLGADGGAEGPATVPPLRRDSVVPDSSASDPYLPSEWPLAFAGFVTRSQTDAAAGHPGLDIAAPTNSPVRAAGGGVVRDTGTDGIYGEYVLIAHRDGLESLYGHASRILVQSGDRVTRGEVIALTGSTGQSSGPHLHFEIRRDGKPVDPLLYVKQPRGRGT